YTNLFDRRTLTAISEVIIDRAQLQAALARIPADQAEALQQAAERVRDYHSRQQQPSWSYQDDQGNLLGQKVTPLDRVGLYVPGGKAAYPSSVLMSAIPAKVAGVPEVVMVSPSPDGQVNDLVLAAAAVSGVERIYSIGGAQAVAALAYGTATIPKVDKIVGPGNIYVATAKRAVFGLVDIDMIAGPSEILILADGSAPADWLAMDLFSQAEHDEDAQAILISPNGAYLEEVAASIERLLPSLSRAQIACESLTRRGALIKVADMPTAIALANRIAPEHLELALADAEAYIDQIRHAGAIFVGSYTSESLGDYCAGPSHVLPTSGTARFSSPLGVYDFQKRSSVIGCSRRGAQTLGRIASVLARAESLEAHARSAEYRLHE
ncbi:MAG TPA: histidinol dehydrogenase, partial [Cellvibrionaceae bacterium]|nr:histidinol dehydrogenase [Cellvibrionaceae bacterium]